MAQITPSARPALLCVLSGRLDILCFAKNICKFILDFSFADWQRKLRDAACEELLPSVNETNSEAMIPQGWAVCEEPASDSSSGAVTIEIGKCPVKVELEVSAEQLEKIFRVLMKLC